MNVKELQRNWDKFGKTDPFWAILTRFDKIGNRWKKDDFFKTGEKEIESVMRYIESLGIKIRKRKALDFGCGVGRLTQPLARYFDEVCGIDIAKSMIELAKKYNRYGNKCKYYVNEADDLKLFADNSFDFIYSNITLQHMAPRYSKKYIKEFLRILAPHGLLIFQLAAKKTVLGCIVQTLQNLHYNIHNNGPRMEMHGVKRANVVRFLKKNGAKIIDIKQDENAGIGWISFRYCVGRG